MKLMVYNLVDYCHEVITAHFHVMISWIHLGIKILDAIDRLLAYMVPLIIAVYVILHGAMSSSLI